MYSHILTSKDHDAIIRIGRDELVGDGVISEPIVEIFHLVSELLDIIDDDESIRGELREGEEEVVEVFPLHRIDIEKVKIFISESRDDRFGISPDRVNVFHLAVFEVLYGFDMGIPCIFDRGDGRTFREDTRELEGRVSIRCPDLEEMLGVFLMDILPESGCIFFADIWDTAFDPRDFEFAEVRGEDLRRIHFWDYRGDLPRSSDSFSIGGGELEKMSNVTR